MEICAGERPRERMMSGGPSGLSDSELLAILLRCGSRDCNALELAHRLLSASGGKLSSLFAMTPSRMCSIPGIGPAKSSLIYAAFELGRRFVAEDSGVKHSPVLGSGMVCDLMLPFLKALDREQCWALFLNSSNFVVGRECICQGSLDSTPVDIRRIVKTALDRNAASVILVHNHPSGNPSPSEADQRSTARLRAALSNFGMLLLDHVIIGDRSFFSFADNELTDLCACGSGDRSE